MLRKLLHIFLVFVLLCSTLGIAFSKHFCGEKLVNVEVFKADFKDDCCGGIPMDCCDDEEVSIAPLQIEVTTPHSPSLSQYFKHIQPLIWFNTSILTNTNVEIAACHNKIPLQQKWPDLLSAFGIFLI